VRARWVEPIGRVGLATQGIIYGIVGILCLDVAAGHSSQPVTQAGAIQTVADQPYGRALMIALVAGLALHSLWHFVLAARGGVGPDGADDVVKRLLEFGSGLVYAALTGVAVRILVEAPARDTTTPQEATATVLDWTGGQVAVAAVGLVVIGVGLWHMSEVVRRSFVDDLDLTDASEGTRAFVTTAGAIGFLARGIAYALVGWFLVNAAWTHDPNESGGLDLALKKVANEDYGPGALRFLALGLFVFGVYRLFDARYRSRESLLNT
jgi:hypothetical protein